MAMAINYWLVLSVNLPICSPHSCSTLSQTLTLHGDHLIYLLDFLDDSPGTCTLCMQ